MGHNGPVGRTYRISLPALAAASLVLVTPRSSSSSSSRRPTPTRASRSASSTSTSRSRSPSYLCFGLGAWKALVHLWKRDPNADLESYVAIHQGVIFGSLVLLTGSIWAKISWGHWWLWSENQLVLFLVLFLFYAAYFMLRFSVDAGPAAREPLRRLRALRRRADPGELPRDPARAAASSIRSCSRATARSSAAGSSSRICVSQAAMIVLAYTLYRIELSGKRLDMRLRELREGVRMTHRREVRHRRLLRRLRARARLRRDHRAEAAAARARGRRARRRASASPTTSGSRRRWLSCSSGLRSSSTARPRSATLGDARRPGSPAAPRSGACGSAGSRRRRCSRVQAAREDGFPWGTWAGSLNLFVWLVVGVYLDLGLPQAVPAARPRRDAARGRAARRRARGRRHRRRRAQPLLEPLPRPARRARARRVRRLHARRGAVARSTSGRSGG